MPKPQSGFRMLCRRILIPALRKKLTRCWRSCLRRIPEIEILRQHTRLPIPRTRRLQATRSRRQSISSNQHRLNRQIFVPRPRVVFRSLVRCCHMRIPRSKFATAVRNCQRCCHQSASRLRSRNGKPVVTTGSKRRLRGPFQTVSHTLPQKPDTPARNVRQSTASMAWSQCPDNCAAGAGHLHRQNGGGGSTLSNDFS